MAKGRMINRRIAKSDKLASLGRDRDRVLYFMIYPHLDREGRYSADPRDIKEDCCPRLSYNTRHIVESLNALCDVGLISIYSVDGKQYLEASRFDDFQVGLHKDREAPSEIPPNPNPSPDDSGNCRTSAEKVPLNVKSNVKSKVNVKSNAELRSAVISYLNEKTGKHFEPDSEAAIRCIDARAAKGKTLENFKYVIDVKAAQWLGHSDMDGFLRPETLFGTKMESYLNEKIIPAKLPANVVDPLVGSRRRSFEEGLTDAGRRVLPQIDKEFDEKNLIEKGWDRNQYRRERLAELVTKGEHHV